MKIIDSKIVKDITPIHNKVEVRITQSNFQEFFDEQTLIVSLIGGNCYQKVKIRGDKDLIRKIFFSYNEDDAEKFILRVKTR